MINVSPPTPLERFFAHMGWDVHIRFHRDFPLVDFRTTMDPQSMKIYVQWFDRRTGEIGAYGEASSQFPSATLVASFRLLAGPIDDVLADRRKILNRRTRRHL